MIEVKLESGEIFQLPPINSIESVNYENIFDLYFSDLDENYLLINNLIVKTNQIQYILFKESV